MEHFIQNTILNIKSGKIYSYSLECLWYDNNGEIDLLKHVPQITVNLGKPNYKVNTQID